MEVADELIFGLERSIDEIENMDVDQLVYYYERAVKYHKKNKDR